MDVGPEIPGPIVGEVVGDRYRVDRLIGEGAMGRVYLAQHLVLGHRVAIKFLRVADTEQVRARFIREAKATMALRSDHVVRIFDLGLLPNHTPYIVLEYLEGVDLRTLINTATALPIEEAVDYVLQACEALAEAHSHGIVHRDLKPQNLFRTVRPNGTACIKLLDFGVSKFEQPSESALNELTSSQVLLGSPVFMSPEQIRSSSGVDARADVWSLGVVLYMLLGGGRPFDGEGLPGLCASIMLDPPHSLRARCPNVPPALEAVILRCLEKSRDRRIPNVVEVARALEPFASPDGRRSVERIVHAYAGSMAPPTSSAHLPAREGGLPKDSAGTETTEQTVDEPPRPAQATATEPAPSSASSAWSTMPPTPATPKARSRKAFALAPIALAIIGVSAIVTWLQFGRTPVAAVTSTATPVASAASITSPVTTDKPVEANAEPPKPSVDEPSTVSSAQAPPRARHPAARPVRPSVTTGSAKKNNSQVDRNGVPILD